MKTESTIEAPDVADIDRHFPDFIGRFGGNTDLVKKAALLLSRSIRKGHICLDLRNPVPDEVSSHALELPDSTVWERELLKSPAFGLPDTKTPLVVDSGRIYLRRYWDYEQSF